MTGFGQWITAISSTINTTVAAVTGAIRSKDLAKAETKREALRIQSQERMAEKDLAIKQQELALQYDLSARRDVVYKEVAIYSIVAIGVVGLLITGAVLKSKKSRKKRNK